MKVATIFDKNNVIPKKNAMLSPKKIRISISNFINTNTLLGPQMTSGSFGAIIKALTVTPLEVMKVCQKEAISNTSNSAVVPNGTSITQHSHGCETFVLNNGLVDCVLPKSSIPVSYTHLRAHETLRHL
eukprot:4833339-Ditylum_brightwellii.AAC.1